MRYKFIFMAFIIGIIGCSKVAPQEQDQNDKSNTQIKKVIEKPEIQVQYFDRELIAKAAISSIMGRPIKNVESKKQGEIYFVSYVRQDDNQFFSYKVKIEGNKIIWGSPDGRWRDTKYDEKITFTETEDHLKIKETFSDKSFSTYDFKLKDFN